MGGDESYFFDARIGLCLNPPRPHGRGPNVDSRFFRSKSLNPPRPHGRGQDWENVKATVSELKSTPPAWAGTGLSILCSDLIRA